MWWVTQGEGEAYSRCVPAQVLREGTSSLVSRPGRLASRRRRLVLGASHPPASTSHWVLPLYYEATPLPSWTRHPPSSPLAVGPSLSLPSWDAANYTWAGAIQLPPFLEPNFPDSNPGSVAPQSCNLGQVISLLRWDHVPWALSVWKCSVFCGVMVRADGSVCSQCLYLDIEKVLSPWKLLSYLSK